MKRLMVLLVASIMALFLVACGENTAEKQEQERAQAVQQQENANKVGADKNMDADKNMGAGQQMDNKSNMNQTGDTTTTTP